jgi:hypothetical protein
MSDTEGQYEDGYGKPPAGRHLQKGQSGNSRGPRGKNMAVQLVAVLNESASATTDACRRKITKRDAVVARLVKTPSLYGRPHRFGENCKMHPAAIGALRSGSSPSPAIFPYPAARGIMGRVRLSS